MTREQYLKNLIKKNGFTIKDYAKKIDMPYSTLLTMLNEEKIGNAAVDSVIRICQGLNITIQDLQSVQNPNNSPPHHLILSQHEKLLISNYRKKKNLQKAIDILLLSDANDAT
ncbi:MAG: helix-turn-helix transcriptional regulator [Firmicutes bacterium]|nr:helix-turn-helix transcriptional regulator [Bacillota bacterium]